MFKVKKKDTWTKPFGVFIVPLHMFRNFSSVAIANFERVNICWVHKQNMKISYNSSSPNCTLYIALLYIMIHAGTEIPSYYLLVQSQQ